MHNLKFKFLKQHATGSERNLIRGKLHTINIAAKFFVCKYASSKWGKCLYWFALLKCVPKKKDWANMLNWHSSKSIWMIKLPFCQNEPPMGESFWQKDSLMTHILFELCRFRYLSQPTFFGYTLFFPFWEAYCMRAIITHGLHTFYPSFWSSFMNCDIMYG